MRRKSPARPSGGIEIISDAAAPPPAASARSAEVFTDYRAFTDVTTPSVRIDPDAMCYIYFTSGSTGVPKAIAGRYKSLGHFIRWEIDTFALTEGCRVSQLINFSFDPFLRDVFVPLCCGGVICAPPSQYDAWDPPALVAFLRKSRVNLVHCLPLVLRGLLREASPSALPSLKYVLSAGEPLFPSDARRWFEAFPDGARLVNLYGPTETTMAKFFHVVTREDARAERVPVGLPIDSTEALVLDEAGAPCPPGTVGEICIRTPYASLGYFRQPGNDPRELRRRPRRPPRQGGALPHKRPRDNA